MNEDLEQRNSPIHIYTHDRLLNMIERNEDRLRRSGSFIINHYNRFFNTHLTPNEFLESISQATVDELRNRTIDPSMEAERELLLVEIDRYRKIRSILREIRGMLMIMRYNRLSSERRRDLNDRHLQETGITYITEIARTMPRRPFYFRRLRTNIPNNLRDPITLESRDYDEYRFIGGNKITLGGLLPETLINPVLVQTRRSTNDSQNQEPDYDLDLSCADARENTNNAETKRRVDSDTKSISNIDDVLRRIRNLIADINRYSERREFDDFEINEVRQLIESFERVDREYHSVVLDALENERRDFYQLLDRLRSVINEHDNRREQNVVADEIKERVMEDDLNVNDNVPQALFERVRELYYRLETIRFTNNAARIAEISELLAEYDALRLNPDTAEFIRSMNARHPSIIKRIDVFRQRINDMNRPEVSERVEISNVARLRERINNVSDPDIVLFNHDVEAFHEMAEIIELYHVIKNDVRFNEKPTTKISPDEKLSRRELEKLKRIVQVYRYIYTNPTLREGFLRHQENNNTPTKR